jgi:hypothetical protein
MDLYIYYRAACAHEHEVRKRVTGMQKALAVQYGVTGALKRRPEPKDGRHTWMEVYAAAPDGFESVLASAVCHAGLAALIEGERHIEFFMDIHPCA